MSKDLKNISILMISLDAGLLNSSSNDVVLRHKEYANSLKRLDILVLAGREKKAIKLSDNLSIFGLGKKISSFFKAYQLGKKLFLENKYDLIDTQDPHLTGLLGYLLKKKFHVKLEIHFHGDFWNNKFWLKESWKNRIFNILQKFITTKVDAIRVVNHEIKHSLVLSGISEKNIAVIHTPVNEKEFTKSIDQFVVNKIKEDYKNKKIILFVGRFVAAKNLFFLLSIIKKINLERQDFVLLLIGDGEQKADLLNFIIKNRLEDVVKILATQTHNLLVNYYQAADFNILLSTNESFGKVVIESAFAEKPSLASRASGPKNIIENNKNGILVDINDFDQTFDKIVFLLDHQELLEKLGKQAKVDFSEKYGQQISYQKIKDFWFKIVNCSL